MIGLKLEKSAQPASELEVVAGEERHASSVGTSVEEEEDKGEDAEELFEPEAGTMDAPVSMGMSSKLAVHTGPTKIMCWSEN